MKKMKKNNLLKTALLFVSVLALTSCSSDDSGESNGTTTGDYWPMKVNNAWNFDNNGTTEQLKISATAEFGGTTYYELQDEGADAAFDAQNWVTKKGATYYQKSADFTTVQSGATITIKGYEVPAFKDDLAVNETWSGTLRPKVTYSFNGQTGSLPTTVHYTGTIIERDATETINGEIYSNIIKMTMSIQTNVDGQTNTIETQYWFAKDIGPVKQIETVDNGASTERLLISYVLN